MVSLSASATPLLPDEHSGLSSLVATSASLVAWAAYPRTSPPTLLSILYCGARWLIGVLAMACAGIFFSFAAYGQVHFTDCITQTGNDATLIIPSSATISINGTTLEAGDELAVMTATGQCAGTDVWTGDNLAFPIWGDDGLTLDPEGFAQNETLHFRIWDASEKVEYSASNSEIEVALDAQHPYATSNATYIPNALYIIKVLSVLSTAAID